MSKPTRPMGGSMDAFRQLHAYERYADEMDAWLTDTVLPVLRRELKRSESSIHGPNRENDCIQCGAFADVRDIITELEDSHESAQGAT